MSKKVLQQSLEALLFVSAKSLTEKKLAALTGSDVTSVHSSLEALFKKYRDESGGVRLMKSGSSWQMVTADTTAKIVAEYIKDEVSGELTKPSLEALAIIAYRGPVTRAEIEEIRGVNCSIILRNLLIRGLVEETKERNMVVPSYHVTVDFLKYLGIERVSMLPDYNALRGHEIVEHMLKKKE